MTARFSHDALPLDNHHRMSVAAHTPSAAITSDEREFAIEPVYSPSAVYVPDDYEPNYAYPLLIWLHDEGGSERDLLRIMPQISRRNYFGLSLRGPLERDDSRGGYRWSQLHDDVELLENELLQSVRHLRQTYHIHSERVSVGGRGIGATLALRLLLQRPEWFAGAVALDGDFPLMDRPLANFRRLNGKRVMIASPNQRGQSESKRCALLHAAGMTVCPRRYDFGKRLHRDILRDIDRWMMQECYRAVTVDS